MNTTHHRLDTPGCKNQIFFNSAGSSLMPDAALRAMVEYLQNENIVGGYELATNRNTDIQQFYVEVSMLLNCNPKNIAFANSATDAYAKALSSIIFKKDDVILTTSDDYVSNQIAFLSLKKRLGIKIIRVAKLANNNLDFVDFENKIKKYKPKLVAVTHIPTNTGLVQNVAQVGELCQKYNILFLLDACQSVGQTVVDVHKIKCDFLTATGRKFLRGPRGTGFLYVSDKVLQLDLEPLFLDLKGAIWTSADTYKPVETGKRFESWEMPHAAIIGFAASLKYLNNIGIENIEKYNQKISAYFRMQLATIQQLEVMDRGLTLSNIITLYPKTISLENIEILLQQHKICYSVATKNNAIIDFETKKIDWSIRFSPHYFNTFEEIDTVIEVLKII